MTRFTVACVQMTSGSNMEENLRVIRNYVAEARAQGADWVLLPEHCALMGSAAAHKKMAGIMTGNPVLEMVGDIARTHGVWLLAGSLPIRPEERVDKMVNRSVLFDNAGRIVEQYDKMHLCDINPPDDAPLLESQHYRPGNRAVAAQTPWGKVGLTICYDVRFPYLFRALAKNEAIFFAVPSAFTRPTGKDHWEILLRARAIENTCYVFAPAQTGQHGAGRTTWGHSLIVDPWGCVLADAGECPGIVTAVIDSDRVQEVRQKLPSLKHDRRM